MQSSDVTFFTSTADLFVASDVDAANAAASSAARFSWEIFWSESPFCEARERDEQKSKTTSRWKIKG